MKSKEDVKSDDGSEENDREFREFRLVAGIYCGVQAVGAMESWRVDVLVVTGME